MSGASHIVFQSSTFDSLTPRVSDLEFPQIAEKYLTEPRRSMNQNGGDRDAFSGGLMEPPIDW